MTSINKLLLAGTALAAATAALPAQAQSNVASIEPVGAILSAKAINAALVTINTTYKAQIDQMQARQTALNAQMKQMYAPIDTNKDGNLSQEEINAAGRANSPVLKQLQDAKQKGDAELANMQQPIERARAYAVEQVLMKYDDALTAVVTAKKLTLVFPRSPWGYSAPGSDITLDVKNELDRVLPTVSVAPPATWGPSEQTIQLLQQLEQAIAQQAQAAQQPSAPPPATPGKPTQGR